MRYTLRQLEVFLATAHHQNITKAAAGLAMSQSAASGALKDLERQFDVQLFDRVGKRLQTNELGQRLRLHAEALLAMAKDLEDELQQHSKLGHLIVGATLTIGNYLCVDLINAYMQLAEDARVKLEVANTTKIVQEVLNFDIDLGLIEGELNHADLDIIPWQLDKLVCFCAPHHPLARISKITDEDLLQTSWILREAGSGTRQTFNRAMTGLNAGLKVRLELQNTEAIKRAVENRDFTRYFYVVIHRQKYRSAGILQWLKLCGIEGQQFT